MASPHPERDALKRGFWQLLLTHLHAWVHRRLGLPPHLPPEGRP